MSIPNNTQKEGPKAGSTKARGKKAEEIKTEGPLSEKDEVKQAEERIRKGTKK